MAKAFSGDVGAFLPTTGIFSESQVRDINVNSTEFKEFLVNLLQTVNNIALVTNIKETGYFYPQEFVNGGVYFPNPALTSSTAQAPIGRQVVRMVVNFGTLPNAGTTSVAHGISNFADPSSCTRIYGAATTPGTSWIPIPFSSPTLNENIKITVDATNVNITTAIDYSAYTKCYVVVEYITS